MTSAQLIVRGLALVLIVVHLGSLLAVVAQTYDTFNPSYAGHYLRQHLVRPLIGLALAGLLLLLESPVAGWLAAATHG